MQGDTVTPEKISFVSLKEEYFSLLHTWLNHPHVQAFYSLRTWTIDEVYKKFTPYIQGVRDIKCYIAFIDKIPVAYFQCYPVKAHPWDNQDLPDEVIQNSAGLDLFIGDAELVGKGWGSSLLKSFLRKEIWPYYRYCLVDPDIRNKASIRLFKKCEFKEYQCIPSKDALKRSITIQLFIKERGQCLISPN